MKSKNNDLKPWTTLSSEVVHRNPWYSVVHEKFVTPSKNTGDYYVIHTNETPLQAAKKELEEELGVKVDKWTDLGMVSPWSGPCAEMCSVFLAEELFQTKH
jgi:hypothetical protein